MSTTLGINITPTTVAVALLEDNRIIDALLHHFNKGEHPDGSSLAATRRGFRMLRIQTKRKLWRKKHVIKLFKKHFNEAIDPVAVASLNPWELRVHGLSQPLSVIQLFKVISHISSRRGFKSSRKDKSVRVLSDKKDKDLLLKGMTFLKEEMQKTTYRTVGEFLYNQPKKRNHEGSYIRTVDRDLVYAELKMILEKQKQLNNTLITDAFISDMWKVVDWKAPIPSFLDMVGACTLETEEKRAVRFAYTSECFTALSDLANLKILDSSRDEILIDQEDKDAIFKLAHEQKTITFASLRKRLKLPQDQVFNLVSYYAGKTLKKKAKEAFDKGDRDTDKPTLEEIIKDCEKKTFISMFGYHTLKECVEKVDASYWKILTSNTDLMDEIVTLISMVPDEDELEKALLNLKIPRDVVEGLLLIDEFRKVKHLSLKAMRKIIPFLKDGVTYSGAVIKAGYTLTKVTETKTLVPQFAKTNSPVVNRALSRTRKVLNAVIRKHGLPDNIHIEIARELPKSFEERRLITKNLNDSRRTREIQKQEAAKIFNRIPTAYELEKYRLWLEQDKLSFYSGKTIAEHHLVDPTYTEVGYIIPFSRSFDDCMNNKILCFIGEIRNKNNNTPYEMYGEGTFWEGVTKRSNTLPMSKAERVRKKVFDERKERAWQNRYLNDTRHIATSVKNHLEQLQLKGRIHVRPSPITRYLKGIWGLQGSFKDIRNYVLDAFVIAASSDDMIKKISKYNKYKKYLAKAQGKTEPPKPDKPWNTFVSDVITATSGVFVSRTPICKATGSAHAEKVLGVRWIDDKNYDAVRRIELKDLTLENIEQMVDKETTNKGLYKLLKNKLLATVKTEKKTTAKGKEKIKEVADTVVAFSSDVYYNGILVRKVKCYNNRGRGLLLRHGVALNKENIRSVDIFKYQEKLYVRPNYTAQLAKNKLASKCENLDVPIDSSFTHIHRIFKNDYLELDVLSKGVQSTIGGYFVGVHPVQGQIHILKHLDTIDKDKVSLSLSTIKEVRKYHVDYFGDRFLQSNYSN